MIKNKISSLFLIFISVHIVSYTGQQQIVPKNSIDTITTGKDQLATTLFSQIVSTSSIYEKDIDQVYGVTGLNIAAQDIYTIKKFYCFLEFLVKLEKVENDPQFSQYKSSFINTISQLNNNKPTFPTQDLIDSNDWKSIIITSRDYIKSTAWQTCLKQMVCDNFDATIQIINNINQAQNQIATYLQNIETAYPTQNYTQLRFYVESIELEYYLLSQQRQQYIQQIDEWKNLDQNNLQHAIAQFKSSNFYIYTHNLEKSKPIKKSQNGKNVYPTIPSPTQEQIICYFLFLNIQSNLQTLLNGTNLQTTLSQLSSMQIAPSFIAYHTKDFIYLNNFLLLKNLIDTNKKNPITTTLSITPNYEQDQNSTQSDSIKNEGDNNNNNNTTNGNELSSQANIYDQLITKIFTKDFPTNSLYENKIDTIYGPTGLNLAQDIIQKIKNCYCYLEFLVKLDFVINNKKFNQYQSDFTSFINSSAGDNVIIPTQDLTKSKGWQAISVTEKDLVESPAWQNFLKSMICDSIDSTNQFILDSAQVDTQIAGYLTNIQANYNDDEFTQIRLYSESIQLYELLQSQQKNRYLQQCQDWKNLNGIKLNQAIDVFKKETMYQSLHNNQITNTNLSNNINPTIKSHILAYFMLNSIQTNVYQAMTLTNLPTILSKITTNSLVANFFMYQQSDYTYLYDYLTLTNLTIKNKESLQASFASQNSLEVNTDETENEHNVVIQATKNPFKKTNKATAKAFNKIGKKTTKTIININTGIGKMGTSLATGFINMSGALAYGFVAIGGSKKEAENARAITKKKMNEHKNSLAKTFAATTLVLITVVLFPTAPILGAHFIGSMAVDKRVKNPVKEGFMIPMQAIMKGMAAMTDGMTTGFIEMSAGLTYAGCMIAVGLDPKANINPKLEANKVREKLEKYRMTLNIVMSVVVVVVVTAIVIGITIATGGTTAPEFVLLEEAVINPLFTAGQGAALASSSTIGTELVFSGVGSVGVATAGGTSAVSSAAIGQAATTAASTTTSSSVASTTAPTFLSQLASQTVFDLGFLIGQTLNAGFGVFTALGAVNQDQMAEMQKDQEKKAIQTLWSFVENNKIAMAQDQTSFAQEMHKKHQAAIKNQAVGLQYYKNFLNGSANLVQQKIAQALLQQHIQLLTPDENGLRIADIGSTWGLQTQFIYMYPSQGFISTTLGRPDFPYAQEVAQAPLTSEQNSSQDTNNLTDQKTENAKLWFNQRAITILKTEPNQPLDIEIKFRIIYNLETAYHAGLYLGGNYHDYNSPQYLQSLENKGSIDLNEAHLAKMFVLKRDDAKSNPSIGLYENEGKGWIFNQSLPANIVNTTAIYHMSANLNKDQLTVSFWLENNLAKKITKTVTVNPCDQRTFGIIFSGIAIEWGVVKPNLPIIENEQARPQLNAPTEIDREKTSKAQRQKTQTNSNLITNEQVQQTTMTSTTNNSTQTDLLNLTPTNIVKTDQTISQLQTQAAGNATVQITTNSSISPNDSTSSSQENFNDQFTLVSDAGFSL